MIDQIEFGLVLPGGKAFSDNNVNLTWRTPVKLQSGEVVIAFVKAIDPRGLFVESICALLGSHLGIPIPKPLIVKFSDAAREELEGSSDSLAFASLDATYPSFWRYLSDDAALEHLQAFEKTLEVGVFDEYIANPDRNAGNILYGGENDFFFIDHGHALPLGLSTQSPAEDNKLVQSLYVPLSDFEKYKLLKRLDDELAPPYSALPLQLLSEKAHASLYLKDDEILDVLKFLEKRVGVLKELFKQRLQIGQQELNYEYS